MRSQEMSLGHSTEDACPICGARLRLTEIAPHPNRNGLEIHGYSCEFCGPVKSLVVMRRAKGHRPLLRLM